MKRSRPGQLLTVANGILGSGQLSLAKYLFIASEDDDENLSTHDIPAFLNHVLERIDMERDIHFTTNTTIDTLDYSGDGLNRGSKVTFAATGNAIRKLSNSIPSSFKLHKDFSKPISPLRGVMIIEGPKFRKKGEDVNLILKSLEKQKILRGFPLVVLVDDSEFTAQNIDNFLWVTFTRSNPASDIYGVNSFYENKHWGCKGSLIVDARIKPHHAPPLIEDDKINKKVDRLMQKYPMLLKEQ
jgi:4-hydroxy-3-polyprenylbenzoate decarboxylase